MRYFSPLKKSFLILISAFSIWSCANEKTRTNEEPINQKENISVDGLDISGEWKLNTRNTFNRLFIDEGNTWKMVLTDHNGDTLTQKGKYIIAEDSAVFFRYFGSQHWPNTDTINDYKTSLGAFVLFLNKQNELKNNQEDYDETYSKVD